MPSLGAKLSGQGWRIAFWRALTPFPALVLWATLLLAAQPLLPSASFAGDEAPSKEAKNEGEHAAELDDEHLTEHDEEHALEHDEEHALEHDEEHLTEHEDGDSWGLSLVEDPEDESDEIVLTMPEPGPEHSDDVVEPDPDAPSTLVVMGAASAVAERFAVDLERILTLRMHRTAALAPVDPDPVLLAGRAEDPEVRLLQARASAGKGLEAYHNLELEEAIELFQESVRRYGQALSARFEPQEMAEAFLMLGATHFVSGNRQQAQAALRQAIILNPKIAPDANVFSPPLMEAFEGARWEVTATASGRLSISTTPSHAEIWVNGFFMGVAPVEIEGPPVGVFYIEAGQRGFIPRTETHETRPGEPSRVDLRLRAGPSTGIFHSYRDAAIADLPGSGRRMPQSVDRLAEMFSVDRIVVGRVTSDASGREALIRAYDVASAAMISEITLDLLVLDPESLVYLLDDYLENVAEASPTPLPEEIVSARKPFVLPAPANDWRFWAGTAAGMAAIAGGVALFSALSSGADTTGQQPHSDWPIIRIPP